MKRRDFLVTGAMGAAFSGLAGTATAGQIKSVANDSITEKKNTPVVDYYDVIVCGAGPAGVSAAIEAGRTGAKTLLIEAHGSLGGIWTAGLLGWIVDHSQHGGMMEDIRNEIGKKEGISPINTGPNLAVDIEIMKLVLEEMCADANVDVLLHTRIVDAVINNKGRLTHVVTESKSGREAWKSTMFIDTTGDGDLAALAGCNFDFGDEEGRTQPMTLLSIVGGPRFDEIEPYIRYIGDEKDRQAKKRLRKLVENAGASPSILQPGLFPIKDDLYMLMGNHMYGYKGIDSRSVTTATLGARKETHDLVNALKTMGGPWSKLRLVATAEQIGTREGRRIKGLYTITKEDLIKGSRFKDAVCRVKYHMDIHSVSKEEEDERINKGKSKYGQRITSQPFDVPIRALIAKDVAGLMMAGRCISGDFFAHGSYRQTGDAVPMGQAAGRVAAMAAQNNMLPQDVKWENVGISVEDNYSIF